jgi:hypothetical protein
MSMTSDKRRNMVTRSAGISFPECHGAAVLLCSGFIAWAGAVAATVAGHGPVAVAAIPTGAGLLGAAAYYSRVRKLPGVELAEAVLGEGAAYQADPQATPTEAVQDFARKVAGELAAGDGEATGLSSQRPYFLHVDRPIPQGMVARATWESQAEFSRFLESQGWNVRKEVLVDNDRRVDMVATRGHEELWIAIKGAIYALNPAVIREIAAQFPASTQAAGGARVRRVLLLPTPPLVISADALRDFRENEIELWYGDYREPKGFVKAT